ncbi:LLM class flavin-dependent oxidoreductase [Streptomyces flaveolus]|uniref:LLM class flavin-dependent oxidoreductase n=1 Tax=Streptomyces flaveolus TaxID=67297 RepID=UPI003439A387
MTEKQMDVGIFLPMPSDGVRIDVAARTAEQLGLDSVWYGDHLTIGHDIPILESTTTLATAAAATERIKVGLGVYLPALRQPVWAVKHIASLQYLIPNDRFLLGVGLGGRVGTGPDEWEIAGVPWKGRAARTDAFLSHLGPLLAGEEVIVNGTAVTLAPPVSKPPVWIGGDSDAALRRAARFGEGWLGTLVPPSKVRTTIKRLEELAEECNRPRPTIGVVLHGGLTSRPNSEFVERHIRRLAGIYNLDLDFARSVAFAGTPNEAAERLAELREAGVGLVTQSLPSPWQENAELLAETRALLG